MRIRCGFLWFVQVFLLAVVSGFLGTARADSFFGIGQFSSTGFGNEFEIFNLTDSNGGGSPFDVASPVDFLDSTLTLHLKGGGTTVLQLSNTGTTGVIDPTVDQGSGAGVVAVQVPIGDVFTSATFSAMLSTGTNPLILLNSTTIAPSTSRVGTTIAPSNPPDLGSGDFGVIASSTIPEPASIGLLGIAVSLILIDKKGYKKHRAPYHR